MKYKKFLIFTLTILLAVIIFQERNLAVIHDPLIKLGYFGIFITGMLYSYGFSAAPATALLLIIGENHNLFLVALIAGLGSLVTDLVLLKFIKYGFDDEIDQLRKEKFIVKIAKLLPNWMKRTIVPFFGAIVLASPLPDELGIALMAVDDKMPSWAFLMYSFILNTIGIISILAISNA